MTLKELCNKYKDGFTLDLETGQLAKHESGYYVSITNFCDPNPNFDAILKAYSFVIRNLGRKAFIGGWKDGNNYYIDISVHLDFEYRARILANYFGQKAIFDCSTKQSIKI